MFELDLGNPGCFQAFSLPRTSASYISLPDLPDNVGAELLLLHSVSDKPVCGSDLAIGEARGDTPIGHS